MEKVDVTLDNLKRNALREFDFQVDTEEHKKLKGGKKMEEEDDGPRQKIEPILKEGSIQQVFQQLDGEGGHSDVIRSIQFISVTDVPLIMTASLDRKVRITDMDGVDHGTLKQGYQMIPNYHWDFPVNEHNENQVVRKTTMQQMLEEVRVMRDKELSCKKLEEIKLVETKFSTLSFAGS